MLRDLDVNLFWLINRDAKNALFDHLMPVITMMGGGEFVFLMALVIICAKGGENKGAGVVMLAGSAVSYQAVHFLKELVERPRPFAALQGVNIVTAPESFSFPSGHASLAFMAAFVLTARFKRPVLIYALAAAVGFSRIYLGLHYPSDVVAGALIGLSVGCLLTRILEISGIRTKNGESGRKSAG